MIERSAGDESQKRLLQFIRIGTQLRRRQYRRCERQYPRLSVCMRKRGERTETSVEPRAERVIFFRKHLFALLERDPRSVGGDYAAVGARSRKRVSRTRRSCAARDGGSKFKREFVHSRRGQFSETPSPFPPRRRERIRRKRHEYQYKQCHDRIDHRSPPRSSREAIIAVLNIKNAAPEGAA